MTSAHWKTRPIFITSTFIDMQAERDYLRNVVFPELEERLRERRHHLESIDLRWGVETISIDETHQKEMLVLKVCLDEIQRSRPFLIGLIGDRYGWVPPKERMAAATQEASFESDLEGKSVTALEIEYGVLKSPSQQKRCFFYFRESFDYDRMTLAQSSHFSEQHAGEPARAERLRALKERITQELPDRVRSYRADWKSDSDGTIQVYNLEDLGNQVLEDLWNELNEETLEFAHQSVSSWQEQERSILNTFVEQRGRDFIGRADIIKTLMKHVTSIALKDEKWGICITGRTGSGKSALFAYMHRMLESSDVLLLSHAAGISQQAGQVDAMLLRWTEELAQFLSIENPLAEKDTHSTKYQNDLESRPVEQETRQGFSTEEIENTFFTILGQTSLKRRVVLLIDALNQFERSPRASYMTWLRRILPDNVRLIATTIPGSESESLQQRKGIDLLPLSLLNTDEAESIIKTICARYHRTLNQKVLQILLDKQNADDEPSLGIPLWLELAVEELNLLDADDFKRAHQQYSGTDEERLLAMMCDTTQSFPPDVEGMYGFMLEHAEEIHGKEWAESFANLIAVSRQGWREKDIRILLPRIMAQLYPEISTDDCPWNDLRFASLRRTFRSHIVQKGEQGQWDFFHTKMREAIYHRYLSDTEKEKSIHLGIADYLSDLDSTDLIQFSNLMFHYIGADAKLMAAKYYARLLFEVTKNQHWGPTWSLAEHIIRNQLETNPKSDSETVDFGPGFDWVLSLLDKSQLKPYERINICMKFHEFLLNALESHTPLILRLRFMQCVRDILQNIIESGSSEFSQQHGLSVCHITVGGMLMDQGNLPDALHSYRKAQSIHDRLTNTDTGNPEWQRTLAIIHGKISMVLEAQDNVDEAVQECDTAIEICKFLIEKDPDNIQWKSEFSAIFFQYSDLLLKKNLSEALRLNIDNVYKNALAIQKQCVEIYGGNEQWHYRYARGLIQYGDVLIELGKTNEAQEAYHSAYAIREYFASIYPENARLQLDLSDCETRIGDLFFNQGDTALGLEKYQSALAIRERIAALDPGNAQWQHRVSQMYFTMAIVHKQMGENEKANHWIVRCRDILSHMKDHGMYLDVQSIQLLRILSQSEAMSTDKMNSVVQSGFITQWDALIMEILKLKEDELIQDQDKAPTVPLTKEDEIKNCIQSLKHHSAFVAGKAAQKLGAMKVVDSLPYLVNLLQNPSGLVLGEVRNAIKVFGEQSIPFLMDGIQHTDESIRANSIDLLNVIRYRLTWDGNIYDLPEEAVSALLNALHDPVPSVWKEAAFAICDIGERDPDVLAALDTFLQETENRILPKVQEIISKAESMGNFEKLNVANSLDSLGEIYLRLCDGEKAKGLLESALQIYEMLYDADHLTVALTNIHLGDAYRDMMEYDDAMTFYNKAVKFSVAQKVLTGEFSNCASKAFNISYIISDIKELQEATLSKRLEILKPCNGSQVDRMLLAIIECYNDPSAELRERAITLIKEALDNEIIKKNKPKALRVFVSAVHDDSEQIRSKAIATLRNHYADTAEARLALREAFDDTNEYIAYSAIVALSEIAKNSRHAVEVLIDAQQDKNPIVRLQVAGELIQIGQCVNESLALILDSLNSSQKILRLHAFLIVSSLNNSGLDDLYHDWSVHYSAINSAIPALKEALDDPSLKIRKIALSALSKIEGEPEITVPLLIDAIRGKPEGVFEEAVEGIRHIGAAAKEAIPDLIEIIKNHEKYSADGMVLPIQSAGAIGKMGSDAKSVIPELIEVFPDHPVLAIEAFACLSPRDTEALTLLNKALEDDDDIIRGEAKLVIEKLEEKWAKESASSNIESSKSETVTIDLPTITIDLPNLPSNAKPLKMVQIPAGTFMMGSPDNDYWRDKDEIQHPVTLGQPFYLGVYVVTQAQWSAVMGTNPSYFYNQINHPVENVSWNDCQEFIEKLNQMGKGVFRLPTEAEWEYACRAGTVTRYFWGNDEEKCIDYVWRLHETNLQTGEVGLRLPNAWGLYDMVGNVMEWCHDLYGKYKLSAQIDPIGPLNGKNRVLRGNHWYFNVNRSAKREFKSPDYTMGYLGFRLVKE